MHPKKTTTSNRRMCEEKNETKNRKIRNVIQIASVRIKVCIFPQSLVSSVAHRKDTQENRGAE